MASKEYSIHDEKDGGKEIARNYTPKSLKQQFKRRDGAFSIRKGEVVLFYRNANLEWEPTKAWRDLQASK